MNALPLWLTPVSPAYMPMFKRHFLRSLDETGMLDKVELRTLELPAMHPNFKQPGSNEADCETIRRVLAILRENVGRHVIYSGCDMHFYGDFLGELSKAVMSTSPLIVTSMDSPTVHCVDFMSFIVTHGVIEFYLRWIELQKDGPMDHCQDTFNSPLLSKGLFRIGISALPLTYWTIGLENLPRTWQAGDAIPNPPRDIRMHHANYALGSENKTYLLDEIQKRVEYGVFSDKIP